MYDNSFAGCTHQDLVTIKRMYLIYDFIGEMPDSVHGVKSKFSPKFLENGVLDLDSGQLKRSSFYFHKGLVRRILAKL